MVEVAQIDLYGGRPDGADHDESAAVGDGSQSRRRGHPADRVVDDLSALALGVQCDRGADVGRWVEGDEVVDDRRGRSIGGDCGWAWH